MSSYTLVGELPRHHYVWVDTMYTRGEPGFEPAVWYGLVSFPSRLWGCTCLLECGAIYRNIPAHAIAFEENPLPYWQEEDAQTWDCYGERFTTLEYRYLAGLSCKVKAGGEVYQGQYLFTAAPVGDGFSAYPEQAKEFLFVQLDNGRLTIQPTNHVMVEEKSFTGSIDGWPRGLKVQTKVFSCE